MIILYYISYAFWFLVSLLPLRVLYVLSDLIYLLMRYVLRYRRKVIRRNLSVSFPGKGKEELRRIERDFYHYFCDYLMETVKLMTMSERQMRKRMVFTDLDDLHKTLAEGQSVALYLGHYGNWEWVSSLPYWLDSSVQCAQIYHPLENKHYDTLFKNLREKCGARCIAMNEILRRMAEYRRENQTVCIGYISDQTPTWTNIHHWLPFLNHDTPVFTGAERIVKAADHAVFYADVKRIKRGYYSCSIRLMTREPRQTGQWEITETYFRELEKTICRAPAYWLWSHNRWKRTRKEFDRRYKEVNGRVVLKYENDHDNDKQDDRGTAGTQQQSSDKRASAGNSRHTQGH